MKAKERCVPFEFPSVAAASVAALYNFKYDPASNTEILLQQQRKIHSHKDKAEQLPSPLEGLPRLDGGWADYFQTSGDKATSFDSRHPKYRDVAGFSSHQGGRTAPLFLQELCHLASLLSAVALSTLRNNVEGAQSTLESPLDVYQPGSPLPPVDPDQDILVNWPRKLQIFLRTRRTREKRPVYNVERPLLVLGGVSDAEIYFLRMARGSAAKTQLSWYWLSEFIIREHLAGSTGKVAPPIISFIFQFLSDGNMYYNRARMVKFITFPFPHAQLSIFYIMITCPLVAFLMHQYVAELWFGSLLTFLTVVLFFSINEVAIELENPFRNIPNELPIVTLQAQFNEALLVMYSGYHPDFFWKDDAAEASGEPPLHETNDAQGASSENVSGLPGDMPFGAARNNHDNTSGGTAGITLAATTESVATGTDEFAGLQEQWHGLINRFESQSKEIEELRQRVLSNPPASA